MLVRLNYQVLSMKGNKEYLPDKYCLVCEKPFTWRKKWKQNWENVKYCSRKCKSQKKQKENTTFI